MILRFSPSAARKRGEHPVALEGNQDESLCLIDRRMLSCVWGLGTDLRGKSFGDLDPSRF